MASSSIDKIAEMLEPVHVLDEVEQQRMEGESNQIVQSNGIEEHLSEQHLADVQDIASRLDNNDSTIVVDLLFDLKNLIKDN